jgi:hypothetical protein
MYVTVRIYSGSPGLVDALVERESDVKRLIGGIDGFGSYYLVRGGDGEATTISVFETQAGAEESNSTAAQWLRETLPELSVGAPEIRAGEAVLSF